MSVQSKSGFDVGPLAPAMRERLARDLSREERRVLLDHGTEPPFCGTLLDNKKRGVYSCGGCGLPLFSSDAKYDPAKFRLRTPSEVMRWLKMLGEFSVITSQSNSGALTRFRNASRLTSDPPTHDV